MGVYSSGCLFTKMIYVGAYLGGLFPGGGLFKCLWYCNVKAVLVTEL